MAMDSEINAFSAWSLLSLTATAHGVLAYPDELGVRYVYDNTVPNGRYVAVGDLAVIRDNRYVFGVGWIDSIEESDARKIRYRCPNCGSTDFKYRSTQQFAYRCASCGTEFNDDDRGEEELTVQVFTANYSRTFRLADRPFPVKALDPAYIARSQQNAIRRLDPATLRPVLEKYLVTGEPWWETHAREKERIPGGRGVGLSKTRVGQQRFREAMLDWFGEACAFTGPQPPGALEAAHLYLYSANPEHDLRGVCFSDATCMHCSTGGSSPSTPAPGQSRSHQSLSAIQGSPSCTAGLSSCPRIYGHDSSTYKSMQRSLTRPGDNRLDKIRLSDGPPRRGSRMLWQGALGRPQRVKGDGPRPVLAGSSASVCGPVSWLGQKHSSLYWPQGECGAVPGRFRPRSVTCQRRRSSQWLEYSLPSLLSQ
jgi:DNA-directed RNA polymerase subunit RPC12/RpoP